jgi:hypothetical protein
VGFVMKSAIISPVGHHSTVLAPLNSDLLLLDLVGDRKIPDVDVLGALAAGGFAILFQQHCTAIVLVDNVFADFPSLSLDKVSCPADGWHAVINTNELCFRRAASVYLVFGGGDDGKSSSH